MSVELTILTNEDRESLESKIDSKLDNFESLPDNDRKYQLASDKLWFILNAQLTGEEEYSTGKITFNELFDWIRNKFIFADNTNLFNVVTNKQNKAITDTGEYFEDDTVEGALQEIGEILKSLNAYDTTNIIKMDSQGKALATANGGLLANLNDNLIFSCSSSYGWTDMPTTAGVIFINWRYGTNYNIQIAIVQTTGVIYTRVINRNTHAVYRDWLTATNDCIQYSSTYSAQAGANSVDNKLSNIMPATITTANNTMYTDLPVNCPSGGCMFINTQVSGNYGTQFLLHTASGRMWSRVINRSTKAVHRDWSEFGVDARMKVLAFGDSICRGVRNGEKGFVGDLGLPYKNIGVSSASISNVVTSVMNIPDQIVNLKTSEPNYSPDIIIGEGGINDWSKNAPLGTLSAIPVTTDAEAEALDRSTVMGGLEYMLYKMVSFYPKAQRFFLITHKTWKQNVASYCPTTKNSAGWTQQDLHDAIVECCNAYNVKVIDIYNESMINTIFPQYRSAVTYNTDNSVTNTDYVDFDGIHPLAYGYKEGYVPIIKKALGIGTVK